MRTESAFIRTNMPLLLARFSLSYYKEASCVEYFINRRDIPDTVSSSLVFSCNSAARDLHVSRFHPGLYLQPDSKYLSAACFYLLIHHCANAYEMDDAFHISLETIPVISDSFYMQLKDFNFHIRRYGLGNVVELISDIIRLPVDTSMIKAHIFGEGEIPFLK